ncbi:MAG: thymidine phosphorylase [Firmicutes bacterium]|nr:thymidine phosphorylase [Bacillota bacterium]
MAADRSTPYEVILKKRDGAKLDPAEIRSFVRGYATGEIPDYLAAAFLMAVYFRGLDAFETAALTQALVDSGSRLDLSGLPGVVVDKHSTGGVGDKTSLVLVPLVSAAGVPVAKLSGRGLGHTGGTLDKLASIPGFRSDLSVEEFTAQVDSIGAAISGQTADLVPADKKLYALRDVTATVDSIPLIAASVMSKKIAAGAGAVVLDVKAGAGAFARDPESAFRLAEAMVDIGSEVGLVAEAVVTDMEQPLGMTVGNALEVEEALLTLLGEGPRDLLEIVLVLGSAMVLLGGVGNSEAEARALLVELLRNGAAAEKFRRLISAQGGPTLDGTDGLRKLPGMLPRAPLTAVVEASSDGYVAELNALKVGLAASALGAGRAAVNESVDLGAGIRLLKKRGDWVDRGERLAVAHASAEDRLEAGRGRLSEAFVLRKEPPCPRPLIHGKVGRG